LSKVPGLFYSDGNDIRFGVTERVLHSPEIDEVLSGAAWDLLPMGKYRAHNWHCFDHPDERQPYASLYTTFGCGMGCSFCMIDDIFTVGGTQKSRIRTRSPELIVNEIETLVNEHGVRNIKFIDEMFVLNRKHYTAVAKGLIDRGLGDKINIWAYSRIDTVNEGSLPLLREAGFRWLGLGIESANPNVREGAKKKLKQQQIIDVVQKIKDNDIYAACNYIFGLGFDTHDSMKETLDMAIELNGEWANFYSAMAYPGSSLHKLATQGKLPVPSGFKESGRPLLPEDEGGPGWIGYSQHSYETLPLPTEHLYPQEVLRFRDEAFMKYFTGERYLGMIKKKFGDKTVEHINAMTGLPRLKRELLGD